MTLAPRTRMWLLFAFTWLTYLAIGTYLAVVEQFFMGDALSRVQAAQSVLFSRDPSLSAIGFVFSPLPALLQLPLVAFSPWLPWLTADAMSAVVVSSAFMAGSVVMLVGIARDRGVPWGLSAAVVVAFAVNPMIVFYAANGMSEAPSIFFLLWATRGLLRWVDTDDVHELIVAGVALALCYLTRYEGGAAALAAGAFVAAVSYRRRDPSKRRPRAVIDAGLVVLPPAVAFVAWAVTSWLVTGDLFAQFASDYGNSAILQQMGGPAETSASAALRFSLTEILILAPLLPVLLALVAAIRYRRHRLGPLVAALAVFGAALAFQVLAFARGTTFGFLRFYLAAVPLASVIALLAVPAAVAVPWRRLGRHAEMPVPRGMRDHRNGYLAAAFVAAFASLAAVPVTITGMTSEEYAPQEFALATVVAPDPGNTSPEYLHARKFARAFSTERELAQYLDSLHLPEGSVLTDTAYGFAVVARSSNPAQFIIPSDRDFTNSLNDPAGAGVQYLLTVPNTDRGASDPLNVRYPTLYDDGGEIAVLELEAINQGNQGVDLPNWRLYRLTK